MTVKKSACKTAPSGSKTTKDVQGAMTKFAERSSAAKLRVMLSDRVDHEVKKAFLTQLSPLEKQAFGGLARGLLAGGRALGRSALGRGGARLAGQAARGGSVAGANQGFRTALRNTPMGMVGHAGSKALGAVGSGAKALGRMASNLPSTLNKGMYHAMTMGTGGKSVAGRMARRAAGGNKNIGSALQQTSQMVGPQQARGADFLRQLSQQGGVANPTSPNFNFLSRIGA